MDKPLAPSPASTLDGLHAHIFYKNECLVFSWWKLYLPYLIFKGVEGWGEKEICTKGVSDGQKEGEGRRWGKKKERGGIISHLPSWLLKTSGYIHDNQAVLDCAVSVDPDVSPITWEQRESKGEPTTACIDTNQQHS